MTRLTYMLADGGAYETKFEGDSYCHPSSVRDYYLLTCSSNRFHHGLFWYLVLTS